MIKIYSEDREFLRALFKEKKVRIYYLHEKFLLSPVQMARTLNKFIALELIKFNGEEALLTELGEKWIIANRTELFLNGRNKYWKEIPSEMKQDKIKINGLFKPDRKKLDQELFKNFEDGK